MTRTTSARIAGFAYLFYMAVGATSVFLINRATHADGVVAILTRIAAHAQDMRVAVLLEVLECFSALVLAVTLYGLTRDQHHELAVLVWPVAWATGCSVRWASRTRVGLLAIATAGAGPASPAGTSADALGSYFLMPSHHAMIGAPFFAVGSAIFAYLMLRGRMVPVPLA